MEVCVAVCESEGAMGPWFCELCDYIALDITDSLVPFQPEPSSCSIIPGEFFCSALLCSKCV